MLLLLSCAGPDVETGRIPSLDDTSEETGSPPDSVPPDSAEETGRETAIDTDSGDTAHDTATPECGTPDPDRATDFGAVMARLAEQGCLDDDDLALAAAAVDAFHTGDAVWCDAVYRLSSPDGWTFPGEPELVREHASVPDATITSDGTHVVAFNDLTPDAFVTALEEDPSRLWRQGLVGIGGVGMVVGPAWAEAEVDLHLDAPMLVVDPDLAARASDFRLVTFGVDPTTMDGVTWDPYATPEPHAFYRAIGADYADFSSPVEVVASDVGPQGGADPTVLDDGADEVLFAGDFTSPMLGWSAPGGVYPALGTLPDVVTAFVAGAPDVVADPDGGWRVYFFDPMSGQIRVSSSIDGHGWMPVGAAIEDPAAGAPSVVVDGDGTWWMYFVMRDQACESDW